MISLAFFMQQDHNDAQAETQSLSLFSLFIGSLFFYCLVRSFGNDVKKTFDDFENPRHRFISPLLRCTELLVVQIAGGPKEILGQQ